MSDPKDNPILVAQTGALTGQRWALAKEECIIGRGADCDVVVDDKTVSRHHAKINRVGNTWLLSDASKNGTHVNGQPIVESYELRDSDVIAIATAVKLVFVASEATLPLSLSLPKGGRLRLDILSRRVWVNNAEIDPPFSLPQYRFLELLYIRNGEVCGREDMVKAVWPEAQSDGVSEQAIDALVRRLRDRLVEFDPDHSYIVTVRGHGFRLDNPAV
jgi:pSer/pThr/pTyr-binding forkhead associated (FHA) protein